MTLFRPVVKKQVTTRHLGTSMPPGGVHPIASANVVVWKKIYETFRKSVIAARLMRVTGRIERDGLVTHLIAERSRMSRTCWRPSATR